MYDSKAMVMRIKRLKKQQHLNSRDLAEKSGVAPGTLNKILSDQTKDPQISNIIKIAHALGVSADYLLFGTQNSAIPLAEGVRFKQYGFLDGISKAAVHNCLDFEYVQTQKRKQSRIFEPQQEGKSFTPLLVYDMPASAGTGQYLDSSSYEIIDFPSRPYGTDFGIRICGDSMEPLIKSGSIVCVKKQELVENGEIGIFNLNGESLCKKLEPSLDGLFLVSLNPKYPPIPIGEYDTFFVVGKVLLS